MGCVTFGREIDRDTSFRILDHAFDRGIRFFDTAEAYGGGASERILGEWIASRGVRRAIAVETKALRNFTEAGLREAVSASLERLRIDCIDIYLLHQPDPVTPLTETLPALALLRDRGWLLRAGSSNFPLELLEEAARIHKGGAPIRLDITQPNYNLVHREIEGEWIAHCQTNAIEVVTYSPLGAGFLTGKYLQHREPAPGTRFDVIPGHCDVYFSENNFATMERLRQLSGQTGHTMAQLAMRWVFANPLIQRVLVGAREPAQIDNALAARQAMINNGEARSIRGHFET